MMACNCGRNLVSFYSIIFFSFLWVVKRVIILWQLTVRQVRQAGRQALLCVLLLLLLLPPSPAVGGVRTPDRWEVRLSFCPAGTSVRNHVSFPFSSLSRCCSFPLALSLSRACILACDFFPCVFLDFRSLLCQRRSFCCCCYCYRSSSRRRGGCGFRCVCRICTVAAVAADHPGQ